MASATRVLRSGIVALAVAGTGLGTAQVVLAPSAFAAYGTVRADTAVNVRAGTSLSTTIVGVLYPGDRPSRWATRATVGCRSRSAARRAT